MPQWHYDCHAGLLENHSAENRRDKIVENNNCILNSKQQRKHLLPKLPDLEAKKYIKELDDKFLEANWSSSKRPLISCNLLNTLMFSFHSICLILRDSESVITLPLPGMYTVCKTSVYIENVLI